MDVQIHAEAPLFAGPETSVLLFGGVMSFLSKHFFFGAAAAPSFLAADLLNTRSLGLDESFFSLFDLIEQETAGQEPIESLLPGFLAFDLYPGRTVQEHDAGRGFVDVLAAVSAGSDKCFLDITFVHTKRGHARGKLGFFVCRNRVRGLAWCERK